MDVTVKVRNVFVVVLQQNEILKCIAIPADVVSDLVAREVISISVVMIQLIQNAMEEAFSVSPHTQNMPFIGEH
jgi:hypothetical protein